MHPAAPQHQRLVDELQPAGNQHAHRQRGDAAVQVRDAATPQQDDRADPADVHDRRRECGPEEMPLDVQRRALQRGQADQREVRHQDHQQQAEQPPLLREQAREHRRAAEQPGQERDGHEERGERGHDRVEQPPRVAGGIESLARVDRDERCVQRPFAEERAKLVRHLEGHEEHVRRDARAEEARGAHFAHEPEHPAGQRPKAGLEHAGKYVVFFRHLYRTRNRPRRRPRPRTAVTHDRGRGRRRGRLGVYAHSFAREPAMP